MQGFTCIITPVMNDFTVIFSQRLLFTNQELILINAIRVSINVYKLKQVNVSFLLSWLDTSPCLLDNPSFYYFEKMYFIKSENDGWLVV